MNIWGPSRHARPRGLAAGDDWGTAFALPVTKADMRHPVNVVEDALLPETKISFREAHPDCPELPPPPPRGGSCLLGRRQRPAFFQISTPC